MPKSREKLVIIDGNALIHRGFHALPQNLRTTDGVLVNGVYGFTTTVLNVMRDIDPKYFIVTFDKRGKVFRHKKFPEYKAKRAKAPQELYDQIPIVKDVVKAMSIPIYEKTNYEADDLIGSLAETINKLNASGKANIESYVVTGDKDTLQLANGNTKIYTLKRGFSESDIFTPSRIKQEYGFGPEHLVDFRGLKGDNSDNIPGVPGVGEKTAMQIIQEYKTLEALYKALDKIEDDGELKKGKLTIKGKMLKNLKENKDLAFLSKELSIIVRDLKLDIDLKKSTLANYDAEKVKKLFQKLQFKSLLKRLPDAEETIEESTKPKTSRKKEESSNQASLFDGQNISEAVLKQDFDAKNKKAHYQMITTSKDLKKLVADIKKQGSFTIDTETTSIRAVQAELVGISICFKAKSGYYIPVAHKEGEQLSKEEVLETLRPVLESNKIEKCGHHIKYDYVVLYHHGVEMQGITFDTLLAAYVLNPGERGLDLDSLAFTELGYEMLPIDELIGKGKKQGTFDDVPLDVATFYASEDADITFQLKEIFEKRLKQDKESKKIFDELEVPMIPVLGHMEYKGIFLDVPYLEKTSKEFEKRIQKISENIFKQAGEHFNISSTQQLSKVLFEKMKVPTEGIARTQTGFSTKASELEKLKGKAKIVDNIIEYRELTKLKNTYIDALPKLVNPKTHRIHTTFNQTIAATGRLSSTDPNLQNIPIRTDEGMKIREAFYADKGHTFVALDYSQIELRIMAHISKDETFTEAFKKNKDIHATVAAQIHGKKPEEVTSEERREAKIINFAILYGAGARGLSQQTTMNYAEAKEYVEKYFEIHPKIRKTIDAIKEKAHEQEYVSSLYGRKRPLPDINASHQLIRSGAERAAINMPFQGTNADIMKLAMLEIARRFPELVDQMILQIHDELVFELPDKDVKKYAKKIKDLMEGIFKLDVPLNVDVESGKRWSQLKSLNL